MNHSVAIVAQQVMEVIDIEASHPATCPCALCFASRIEPCNLQTGPVVPYNADAFVLDNVAVEEATGGTTPQVQNEEDEARGLRG